MDTHKLEQKTNDMTEEEITQKIKDGVPYIEIGETRDGAIYFRSLKTYDEELEKNIVNTVVGAMMDNPDVGFMFMLAAITYIDEMSGEDDAQKVVDVLTRKLEMKTSFFKKKNNLQN